MSDQDGTIDPIEDPERFHHHVDPLEDVGTTPTAVGALAEEMAREGDAERQRALETSRDLAEGSSRMGAKASGAGLPNVARLAILGCALALILLALTMWILNRGDEPSAVQSLRDEQSTPRDVVPTSPSIPVTTSPFVIGGEGTATTIAGLATDDDPWCGTTERWFLELGFVPENPSDPESIRDHQQQSEPFIRELRDYVEHEAAVKDAIDKILADPDVGQEPYGVIRGHTMSRCEWPQGLDPPRGPGSN